MVVNLLECRNGCGKKIYFDQSHKSQSGKMIPLEAGPDDQPSGKEHSCPLNPFNIARGKKDKQLGKPIYEVIKELFTKYEQLEERIEKLELSRWNF